MIEVAQTLQSNRTIPRGSVYLELKFFYCTHYGLSIYLSCHRARLISEILNTQRSNIPM